MKYVFLAFLFSVAGCTSKKDPLALPETIEEAVASNYRSPENKVRDIYRHPTETLKFFGLTDDSTVLEISPGRGWYMEILAPYLTAKGRYIMAIPVADRPYYKANEEALTQWQNRYPQVKIEKSIFSPPKTIKFPENGSVDLVVTFRNVHNWMGANGEQQAFDAFYRVLKPGGILGVVEHRADPSQNYSAKSGYVSEQAVIEIAAKAGFKLVGTSEINANPKDKKNYPEGVWTLPPSLRLGEKDRATYVEIGESDRMTLKFMKPKI